MNEYKSVAAIHDISGVGRCSLSVIMPTMSVMGIQVCAVPTAVLSAHTNGFGDVVMKDMTEYIPQALEHYKRSDVSFDCVYTGFLASARQVSICLDFFDAYPNALKIVDPVMGDSGKRYKTYTPQMCECMAQLVAVADVITPNLTEASILLGIDYPVSLLTLSEVKSMLVKLSGKGPDTVVITSVPMADGKNSNVGYDRKNNAFWRVTYERCLSITPEREICLQAS